MTEQLNLESDTFVREKKDEITARQVEELILATDPEIILHAAYVVSHLPRMSVVDGELVEPPLSDQINQRIADTTPAKPSRH